MSSRPALPSAEEIGALVPIGRIAKETPYSADFLRQLARSGKIRAFKLNRDWLTTPEAVRDYLKSQSKRHEKALAVLQAAEKTFMTLALVLIVFSATPQARAQNLSNPPPITTSAMSAVLDNVETVWQRFAEFYGRQFAAIGSEYNQVLLSFGQALLGKTTEEYMADSPTPIVAVAKHPIEPRGRETPATAMLAAPQVLGISTTTPSAPVENPATPATQITSSIQSQVNTALQIILAQGLLTGPAGPPGPAGPQGASSDSEMINNGDGQTTAAIDNQPIVSYYPADTANNFNGASVAGFSQLSAQNLTAQSAVLSGSLTAGTGIFSGQLSSGPLTVSGAASISGALSAGAGTLSSLTVSGNATFSGSTTIAGLTVTGFNPGLTQGSIAFQGATSLAQDNSNFFYSSINHSLGLGTSSPTSTLFIQGSGSVNPFVIASSTGTPIVTVTASGNVGIGTTSPVAPLEVDGIPAGTNGFFLLNSIGGVPRGGLTSKDSNGGTELSFHANVSMDATGSPSTYSLYNPSEPGFAFDLLPRWDEISMWRFTGPNGNLTAQKPFWITDGGQQVRIGTANVTGNPSTANFGGVSPALVLTEGGDATATTTYNSNLLQFESSGWNTASSTYVDRMITLAAVAGSGATSSPPYRLSVKNNNSVEVFNIDALTGNAGVGQVAQSNMYPGITVKSQGFRNVGLGLNTPSGITFQNRQNTGNTAGIGLSDDDSQLDFYTWNGSAFVPSVSIVAASGNVGIGSSSPVATLAIQGTGTTNPFVVTSSTGASALVINPAGNLAIGQVAQSNMYPGITVKSQGFRNVGLGLNTPSGITFQNRQNTGNTAGIGLSDDDSQLDFYTWNGSAFVPSVSIVAASGNVGIGTSTPTLGPLVMASGAFVSSGGTWTNASDRNLKENFATLSPESILEKIDQLPVTQWDYKTEGPTVNHIGPVAQDFWAAFHLGNSSTSISTIDPAGVALLGIQALDQKITALQGNLTGNATTSNLTVYQPSNFSGDSVGQAEILAGQTSVRITFTQAYTDQPIVTADVLNQFVQHDITDVDATGFTIRTPAPVTQDTTFDWHSFASPAEQLTVSDGSTSPIPLAVTSSSQSSARVITAAPANSTTTITSASSTPVSTASTATSTPQVLGASTGTPSSISLTPTPTATPVPSPTVAPTPVPTPTSASVTPTPTPDLVTSHSPSPTPTPPPSETSSPVTTPQPTPSSPTPSPSIGQ